MERGLWVSSISLGLGLAILLFFPVSAFSQSSVFPMIVHPGAGYLFPASFPVPLRANPAIPHLERITWFLDGQPCGRGGEVGIPGLAPGNHRIKAFHPDLPSSQEERNVCAFSWSGKIIPEERVSLWTEGATLRLSWERGLYWPAEEGISMPPAGVKKIRITRFQASSVQEPVGCADVSTPPEGPLVCRFSKPGAVALRASGTLAITQPDGIEEEFPFTGAGSDFWAVLPPEEVTIDGHFPTRAIAKTRRTYDPKLIRFTFQGTSHAWTPDGGLTEPIHLAPAGGDGVGADCRTLGFAWSGPDDQAGNDPRFVPLFGNEPGAKVELRISLIFDGTEKIPLLSKGFPVNSFPLDSLVKSRVDPATFSVMVGQRQEMRFIMEPVTTGGAPPTHMKKWPDGRTTLEVLDGEYQIELKSVDWSVNGVPPQSSAPERLEMKFPNGPADLHGTGSMKVNFWEAGPGHGTASGAGK